MRDSGYFETGMNVKETALMLLQWAKVKIQTLKDTQDKQNTWKRDAKGKHKTNFFDVAQLKSLSKVWSLGNGKISLWGCIVCIITSVSAARKHGHNITIVDVQR